MLDLTRKSLPNTVRVGGSDFSIYTDFRVWMRFEIEVTKLKRGENIDVSYLFKNEMPAHCNLNELFAFSRLETPLPRDIYHRNVITLDYELDSDLIYSAVLGQYGIDLFEVDELHWYKFLALIRGLNDSTRLREVMGYRCYEKNQDKDRDIYSEMRRAWEIDRKTETELEEDEKFSNLFN